jgi:hypothetical protein
LAVPGEAQSTLALQPAFKFQVYDGDPSNSKEMTFQVNVLHLRMPSQFQKLGEMIPRTPYRLSKFAYKITKDGTYERDVSELTLVDVTTQQTVVLPLGKVVQLGAK